MNPIEHLWDIIKRSNEFQPAMELNTLCIYKERPQQRQEIKDNQFGSGVSVGVIPLRSFFYRSFYCLATTVKAGEGKQAT
ncbi:hypothetical protein CDAR_548261 [Caerostris darwini]|uniref:Uncharacterized protein n=1 Tax=Caerostris darwini TaxID=1538125 RepID=A0AAV4RR93_9ARAC|nr:hypothetical protein CDAR_548261 [Caerostris darwini]